jgi:hypothetical protein
MTQSEHQWFLAQYTPDELRFEPRNVGVLVREALKTKAQLQLVEKYRPDMRFLDDKQFSFLRPEHAQEWIDFRSYWDSVWEKHGTKAFYWLTKTKYTPHFRWILAGAQMASAVDFDQMFTLLVLPENR